MGIMELEKTHGHVEDDVAVSLFIKIASNAIRLRRRWWRPA